MSHTNRPHRRASCKCHHYAPSLRVLRSCEFNEERARFYASLDLSGDGIVDWVLIQLFDVRQGWLYDFNGDHIDIDRLVDLTDDMFGADERRFMHRYIERSKRKFRNRLHMRVVFPVMMMHFAREIHLCATQGECSHWNDAG